MVSSSCCTSEGHALRHFIFVTEVYGNIDIYSHDLPEAIESFLNKGYLSTEIKEIR